MKNDYILVDGTLQHHGIQGQKWGVRRFQNEDGSLTPAGIERYNKTAKSNDVMKGYKFIRKNNLISKDERTKLIQLHLKSGRALKEASELYEDYEEHLDKKVKKMADKAMKEHLNYEDEYDKTANEIANKWLKNESEARIGYANESIKTYTYREIRRLYDAVKMRD